MTTAADFQAVPVHVQEWMDRKAAEPGFGKRRYGVRTTVGKATVTLHKSARYGKAA